MCGPRDNGGGCPPLQVAGVPAICVSPSPNDPKGHREDAQGEGRARPASPSLASLALVRGLGQPLGGSSVVNPPAQGHPDPGLTCPPRSPLDTIDCLEFEWSAHSPRVIQTIQASRHDSTNHIYDAIWTAVHSWCVIHNIVPSSSPVPSWISFSMDWTLDCLSTP